MNELAYVLDCLERDVSPIFQDHEDLRDLLYRTLKRNQTLAHVVKAKAHSEHCFHNTPFEQWCSKANAFVDKEAKQSVDNAFIYQNFQSQYESLVGNRTALNEILHFQTETATKSFRSRVQTKSR